nr:hypothetical protein [Tanacetum cinerariifolium]
YEVGESSYATAARPAGGFRADYGFVATVDRQIMRDPEREIGYRITDSWDEIMETLHGAPVSTDTKLDGYVREFETKVRQDTDEIYMRLDDEQTKRQLLAGRLNMLFRDRRAHAYIRQLMETEARMSREAWVRATDASDLVYGEVMSLRTTVLGQMSEIWELQAVDRRRQTGAPVSTDTELGGYVREFETRVRQDTDEIYMRLDDEQIERQLFAGWLNMLFRDRCAHAYTRHLMETEARMSREAWVRATDASDVVHELLRIDHKRSTEISELRTALQGQGLAGDHTQSKLPEEAGGSAHG